MMLTVRLLRDSMRYLLCMVLNSDYVIIAQNKLNQKTSNFSSIVEDAIPFGLLAFVSFDTTIVAFSM